MCDSRLRRLPQDPAALLRPARELGELPRAGLFHLAPGDEVRLAKGLLERNLVVPLVAEELLVVNGEVITNGLFGVEKGGSLDTGRPALRLIMNLTRSNALFKD